MPSPDPFQRPGSAEGTYGQSYGAWSQPIANARSIAFAKARAPEVQAQAARVPIGLQRAANAELMRSGTNTSRLTLVAGGRVGYLAQTTSIYLQQIFVRVPDSCFGMTYSTNGAYHTLFFHDKGGRLSLQGGVQHLANGEVRSLSAAELKFG